MATVDNVLRDKTHKNVEKIDKRIFYILTDHEDSRNHRAAKAFALLMQKLYEKEVLNEKN